MVCCCSLSKSLQIKSSRISRFNFLRPASHRGRLEIEQRNQSSRVHISPLPAPELFAAATVLARRLGSRRVVTLTCGNSLTDNAEAVQIESFNVSSHDTGPHQVAPDDITNFDLNGQFTRPSSFQGSVALCHQPLDHLTNLEQFARFLALAHHYCDALIVCASDRVRSRADGGSRQFSTEGWDSEEFRNFLEAHGITLALQGYCRDSTGSSSRAIQVGIVFGINSKFGLVEEDTEEFQKFAVAAFVACYNESDIIFETVDRLLDQFDCVYIIDNWSDDGSWPELINRYSTHDRVSLERFPNSPPDTYQWAEILQHIDHLASRSPAQWIIRVDADEKVDSFSNSISVKAALYTADRLGYDSADFTLVDFRPTTTDSTLEDLVNFEFAHRKGAMLLQRAWKNYGRPAGIATTGGHAPADSRRVFPLNMVLRHYPLRNREQARRKVFQERLPRTIDERKRLGWHVHYDEFRLDDDFCWNSDQLIFWNSSIQSEFLLEFLFRVGPPFDSLPG